MKSNLSYSNDSLTLTIKTEFPGEINYRILKALTAASRAISENQNSRSTDKEALITITDLLECFIPNEELLSKINE